MTWKSREKKTAKLHLVISYNSTHEKQFSSEMSRHFSKDTQMAIVHEKMVNLISY
jgi:hypothetical protein